MPLSARGVEAGRFDGPGCPVSQREEVDGDVAVHAELQDCIAHLVVGEPLLSGCLGRIGHNYRAQNSLL